MWLHHTGAPAPRILGLVEVSAVDEDLISRTLNLLPTTERWAVSRTDQADLILVDVDCQPGRSRWWSLRHERSFGAIVPISGRRELQDMQPLLLKPVCGHSLRGILDGFREIRLGATPGLAAARHQPLLLEAIMACSWSRFAVELPQGGRFFLDTNHNRLYAEGDLATLRGRLFRSADGVMIRPAATFTVVKACDDALFVPLSRWLSSAVMGDRHVESLAIFRGNPVVSLNGGIDDPGLVFGGALYAAVCVLAAHGPLDLLELVLLSGCSRRAACAALAALWVTGHLVLQPAAAVARSQSAEIHTKPFRTGPRPGH